jgi:hypothetical protein
MGTNNRVLYTPRVDTNARIFDNLLDQLIDNLFIYVNVGQPVSYRNRMYYNNSE